ncbi:FAD-dependent oxidoreductase [Kineococcus sp. SYSU DK018]|uniref:FAD-dependent oxidoreductase n=1 Tax=Kineococcus sp. SYSU DK018 TaxID=3383139 RepID=UPI003D7D298E
MHRSTDRQVRRPDVLVVGGGTGGVAAALAAAGAGARVLLTEETTWVGGQFTSQAVPPDEHPWIEQFGATRSYRRLREGIRQHYRTWYPLRADAARRPDLNPGAGRVSKLCHEPRVALAVLHAMLGPLVVAGRLEVAHRTRARAVHVDGDRVTAVTLTDLDTGAERTVEAAYVLDATEGGDLLALGGVEHVSGAEARSEHGEPHAPDVADPADQQGITVTFAVSHHAGEDHTAERPRDYGTWRSYAPAHWGGPLLSMTAPDPRTLERVQRTFAPNPDEDPLTERADQSKDPGDKDLWRFRRLLARGMHEPGAFDSDVVLVNWPMNDYWELPWAVDDPAARAAAEDGARQLSLSLLHWLQTELPNPDGSTGLPGLRIRPDVTGTPDGLAMAPYVRESRRIRAVRTVTENDVALDVVGPGGGTRHEQPVGVGSYRIDLHPSTGGRGYVDVASVPFEIPLGALLPVRVENLLPAAKDLGTTHVTNGCFRLHPVEWNVGEVAGHLAAFAVRTGRTPRQVQASAEAFEEFAAVLDRAGVERRWPDLSGY